MGFRNHYNNHCTSDSYISPIHEKLATYIQKYYSIALPCWTLHFISGLLLSILGYATHKHKGKVEGIQVNDPSNLLSVPNDSGT